MATPGEVTVSMREVVMVKADEGDPGKTQVILQLQPITPGDESGETDTAVMAVEAHHEHTAIEGEEVEFGYPITCGESKAVLLVKKFVCPGINVKCVKYEDQLISPKEFVHMSGKATLKDWKRAIRMGGVMLRKMMDIGQLDFYEHSTLCTNTCRSTKFDLLINNTRFPPDGSGVLTTPTSSHAQVVLDNGQDQSEVLTGAVDLNSAPSESGDRKDSSEISEETLSFWKGIADVGLMGEVVTNITTELLELLNGVHRGGEQTPMQDAEVAVLSNLAQVFGLLDLVKKILERKRHQTDPSQEQVLSTLTNLEQQLEEQRKQQQVRALLSSPPPAKVKTPTKRPSKRPRLQRPSLSSSTSGTPTLLASPPAGLQPHHFTLLSPILSAGQPFTVAQSPNTLTLLPAGSQVFTRYMVAGGDGKSDAFTLHPSSGLTLMGTGITGPDGAAQMGTMMGPVELLQLTQPAGGGAEVVPMEGQVVEGAVLVRQALLRGGGGEAEAEQEHTVIEINPAPAEQPGLGVVELQLGSEVQGAMEVAVDAGQGGGGGEEDEEEEEEEVEVQVQGHTQQVKTDGVQGLRLDANGQLHIVVIESNTQEENNNK